MIDTYICSALRTPIGKLSGSLSSIPAPLLGAGLVKQSMQQLKVDPNLVDEIIMGQVLSAGVGQAPARQTAIFGGLPQSVCATTINRVCGSGLKSVMLGDQAIKCGHAKAIFAGGQESMSRAPHLLPLARNGYRFGGFEAKDHMQWDGLWDPYHDMPMGNCGETCAEEFKFSREAQDEFARQSYEKALQAIEGGWFKNEIAPVAIKNRKGEMLIEIDEEPGSVDLTKLARLRPAFAKEGTVTAGNASSINDGAALVFLANEEMVKKNALKPLARVVGQANFAHAPEWFTTAPIECINKVLKNANMTVSDIDLFEINEAFSTVTMAAIKSLDLDSDKVNVHGGAVALGHPIGASGTRVLVTLVHALERLKKKFGLATLCIGGGEASAVIVERC